MESFAVEEYKINVSNALDVPAWSVSVSVHPGSVVAVTRVEVDNEPEATRVANEVTDLCIAGTLSDSCTPPVTSPVVLGGGSVTGDPHFTGAHGDAFAFRGGNRTVYALHSSRHLQVNARFVPATFVLGGKCTYCSQKTVHGSFVKSAFFAALTSTNLTVRVAYHADTPSRASIAVDAEGIEGIPPAEMSVSKYASDAATPRTVDEVTVELARRHKREACVVVSNLEYTIKAVSRFIGWADLNKYMKRLDISIEARKDSSKLEVAPHGLIGQTFDGDGMAVDGAVDDYSTNIVVTKAMGEGAIEGAAEDYEIDATDPYSSKFKYSRFHATRASPRNVAALTGLHRHAAADKGGGGMEGANMQGDDALVMGLSADHANA